MSVAGRQCREKSRVDKEGNNKFRREREGERELILLTVPDPMKQIVSNLILHLMVNKSWGDRKQKPTEIRERERKKSK